MVGLAEENWACRPARDCGLKRKKKKEWAGGQIKEENRDRR
jgi:hypothetical protein